MAQAGKESGERDKRKPRSDPLGKIRALGPESVADLPFLLPNEWVDYTVTAGDFSRLDNWEPGDPVVARGRLEHMPEAFYRGVPRLSGKLIHHHSGETLPFTIFGDTKEHLKTLKAHQDDLLLIGKKHRFSGTPSINAEAIAPGEVANQLVPRYPGKKGVIGAATVTERMHALIKSAIPKAVEQICNQIPGGEAEALAYAGYLRSSLKRMLYRAHWPVSREQGEKAQHAIERIRVYAMVREIRAQHSESAEANRTLTIPTEQWQWRASALPFALTGEQTLAVREIVDDIQDSQAMRRLLSGDVGTGKTAVFAVAAAAVLDAGGRVAINAPGEILAQQIFENITGWWPDLANRVALVTGGARTDPRQADMLVGTTALLHRDVGAMDLVIVDEQHRFARHQREGLVDSGVNLLEATATCIPRSMALIQCAGMSVTRLTRAHVDKQIRTRLVPATQRRKLFGYLQEKVKAGEQLLVIYPLRATGKGKMADLMDVETAAERWEKVAPGQVRVASGANDDADNNAAIQAMREGTVRVLVATTVVEVGVDIPELRNALVVHPERFGLATLHQIRGRIARAGGKGEFLLYTPDSIKEKTRNRIRVLEQEQDGFVIAQGDLKIRGFGDLDASSKKQSGASERVLYGRQITPERIEEVLNIERSLTAQTPSSP